MHTLKTRLRVVVAAIAAVGAFAALGASPAAASLVEAKFSAESAKLTTSGVTVKRNGAEAKSCALDGGGTWATPWENLANFVNSEGLMTRFKCPSGTELKMDMLASVWYDTVSGEYSLVVNADPSFGRPSPWGTYGQLAETTPVPWVNGSGAAHSTVTFTDTLIGYTAAGSLPITISGAFTATTSEGKLLTLSH